MTSVGVPEGVTLRSLKTLSESSMSMYLITGKPRDGHRLLAVDEGQNGRAVLVAIWERALFLAWARSGRCSTGCSETRIGSIQKMSKGLDAFAASLGLTPDCVVV
jgi:hypothetical protein